MKRRKKKQTTPIMLLWSRAEQQRFSEAVERFVSTANDLKVVLCDIRDSFDAYRAKKARASAGAKKANETRNTDEAPPTVQDF